MNYFKNGGGCILTPPKKEDAVFDLIFGRIGAEPINWKEYLPEPEEQRAIPFCVSFSRLNCAEAVARKEGVELNLSDRYLGVISGTSKQGNSLQNVSDTFRNKATVKEKDCQWKPEWLNEPYAYWKDIFNLQDIPQGARRYYGGNWSWCWTRQARQDALSFSPVQIAIGVGSNYWGDNIIQDPKTYSAYHAVALYYQDDKAMYVYDSVPPYFKRLSINYKVYYAMSFADLPENWRDIQAAKMVKLVKLEKSEKVYAIIGGQKYWIVKPEDYLNGRNNNPPLWDMIETAEIITENQLAGYPDGGVVGWPSIWQIIGNIFR
jgi:hypothetical protein